MSWGEVLSELVLEPAQRTGSKANTFFGCCGVLLDFFRFPCIKRDVLETMETFQTDVRNNLP